uniref:p38 protein n=1 Tax=Tetrahymena thermophila TaxID=5911 RepID=Q8IEV6_TETTH|nr:p38 protein [Tetrahymena thermophila]
MGCCQSEQQKVEGLSANRTEAMGNNFTSEEAGETNQTTVGNTKKPQVHAMVNEEENQQRSMESQSNLKVEQEAAKIVSRTEINQQANSDKTIHMPSTKFATTIDTEPDYTNNATKNTLQKCGDFIYDCPQYDDAEAVELGLYQLENGSVYKGQWKNGMRHGRGKQLWKDGSIYEGYWKNNMAHGKGRLIHSDADGKYNQLTSQSTNKLSKKKNTIFSLNGNNYFLFKIYLQL